jgi:uncharacterized membrane protein (DUF106 family)
LTHSGFNNPSLLAFRPVLYISLHAIIVRIFVNLFNVVFVDPYLAKRVVDRSAEEMYHWESALENADSASTRDNEGDEYDAIRTDAVVQ